MSALDRLDVREYHGVVADAFRRTAALHQASQPSVPLTVVVRAVVVRADGEPTSSGLACSGSGRVRAVNERAWRLSHSGR